MGEKREEKREVGVEALVKAAPPRPEELLVIEIPLKKPRVLRSKRLYEARREARAQLPRDEVDEILEDVLAEVEQSASVARPGQPIHRLYLLKRSRPEEVPSPEATKVIASKALSEKEEFTEIVDEVYGVLKEAAREESLRERAEVKKPPKPVPPKPAPAPPVPPKEAEVTLEELIAAPPAKPLFEKRELAPPPGAEFAKLQVEGARCPHCKASGLRIVFCPFCGKGLCANCSPKVTPRPEAITYVCPSCGEEIHVKRGVHEK